MVYFAKIENNIVTNVIVLSDENKHNGAYYIQNVLGLSGEWIETSIDNEFRQWYASPGFIYDRENDLFYPPQPTPSWVLNKEKWIWEAPIPYPEDDEWVYYWEEEQLNWIKGHKIEDNG